MNLEQQYAAKWEQINDLLDMIADRDLSEALDMLTIMHEVAKVKAANELPTPSNVHVTDHQIGYFFNRNGEDRKASKLFKAVCPQMYVEVSSSEYVERDDDGVPV